MAQIKHEKSIEDAVQVVAESAWRQSGAHGLAEQMAREEALRREALFPTTVAGAEADFERQLRSVMGAHSEQDMGSAVKNWLQATKAPTVLEQVAETARRDWERVTMAGTAELADLMAPRPQDSIELAAIAMRKDAERRMLGASGVLDAAAVSGTTTAAAAAALTAGGLMAGYDDALIRLEALNASSVAGVVEGAKAAAQRELEGLDELDRKAKRRMARFEESQHFTAADFRPIEFKPQPLPTDPQILQLHAKQSALLQQLVAAMEAADKSSKESTRKSLRLGWATFAAAVLGVVITLWGVLK